MPKLTQKEAKAEECKKGFFDIAVNIAKHSDKKIQYVDRMMISDDAGHLITFKGEKQIGRDIENYRIFCSLLGPEYALLTFLEEIILPVKKYLSKENYKIIEDQFKVLAEKTISKWEYYELLDLLK